MAQECSLELPERVVTKIQKVLGISPESLPKHDLVSLIEELCDTALMFDQNARGADQTKDDKGIAAARGRPTSPAPAGAEEALSNPLPPPLRGGSAVPKP